MGINHNTTLVKIADKITDTAKIIANNDEKLQVTQNKLVLILKTKKDLSVAQKTSSMEKLKEINKKLKEISECKGDKNNSASTERQLQKQQVFFCRTFDI